MLALNIVEVPAGTYEIDISAAVSGNVGLHKLRLYSVTAGAYLSQFEGLNMNSATGGIARLAGVLTLAILTRLEVHHYTQNAVATTGLGTAMSVGFEVYCDAIFRRRKYP